MLQIAYAVVGKQRIFHLNPANLHGFGVVADGGTDQFWAGKAKGQNPAANGKGIRMGEGIDHGGPVGDIEAAFEGGKVGEKRFFGKVDGYVAKGFEGGKGIFLHLLQGNAFVGGHGVVLAEKGIGQKGGQLMKLQISGI